MKQFSKIVKHIRSTAFLIFFLGWVALSCKNSKDPWTRPGAESSQESMIVTDFSLDFYSAMRLSKLKERYPFFFSSSTPDSVWMSKKNDRFELELYGETQATFPDNKLLKKELPPLFKRMKYFYKDFSLPKIYTYVSKIDYIYPVLYTGKYLFVGLDNFLGSNHKAYEGIPQYIRRNMDPAQLLPAIARAIAREKVPRDARDRTFLNALIHQGKILLLADALLPKASDASKIGYTPQEINWCLDNEFELWKYWVENGLLFSKDNKLYDRFIAPGPFSKFYTAADRDSPGMIGVWVGWQIMRSYWKNHPEQKLPDILNDADYKKLFAQSGYKPKRR